MATSLPRLRRFTAVPVLVLGLLALLAPLVLAQPASKPAVQAPGEVLVVKVKSPIHPVSAELIEDAIAEADRAGAAAIVIELDTAGGS